MKNEYKITKEEVMSWANDYHLQGAATIVLFSLWCLVGVIGICMIVLLSVKGGDFLNWFLAILFSVLALYKLLFSRFIIWNSRYRLMSKAYGVSEWIRTTEFNDEDIVVTDHNSITKLRYENIKRIREKDNLVMILFDGNVALRIYKDAFTDGSFEECRELLASKNK